MSGAWPPPPDLASIQELVGEADVEGLIADGAPEDEYEPECESIFRAIENWATAEITPEKLTPVLLDVWRRSFLRDDAEVILRMPALEGLARQIARFFGPEAVPQTR